MRVLRAARVTLTLPLPQAGEGLFNHMLNAFACDGDHLRRIADPSPEALRGAAWIDLISPTSDEAACVRAATGLRIPTEANLSEIESSSRLAAANGVLTLSMPLVSHLDDEPRPLPGGFVLARDRLITIRFSQSRLFDSFAEHEIAATIPHRTSAHLFIGLLEAIVDRHADALEEVRTELDAISHTIFHDRPMRLGGSKHEDRTLRTTLGAIGRSSDLISFIRDSQVSAGRLVPYVQTMAKDWLPADLAPRLTALTQDIASLNDFEVPPQQQAAVPAGCHAGLHQHRAEQRDEGADRGVGGRHSAGADRRHLWHELQVDAGIRLALGLRLRADGDRRLRPGAARLVQIA